MFLYKYQEQELKLKLFNELEATKKMLNEEKVYKYYKKIIYITELYFKLFNIKLKQKNNDYSNNRVNRVRKNLFNDKATTSR